MADKNMTDTVDTTTDLHNDTEPATKHDIGIGGGLGAVGGAIVGGLAGGPIGAIIGAVVGGAASAGAVDVVDKHDHDYAQTAATTDAVPAYTDTAASTVDSTRGTASEYTGPGDYQRTQATAPAETGYAGAATTAYAGDATIASTASDTDRKIELHEEELHAAKQTVQTGEVTLHKEVFTETKTIDVPVTREEIVIERHAVSGGATANANFGADEVIRVPVMEEQVTVQKTPIVTEEVSLGKRQVTETQHITDTVRHEEAHIHNPANVDVVQRGTALDSESDDDLDADGLGSDATTRRAGTTSL